MTQYEYQIICDTLKNGVPALASGLINSLNELVNEHNAAVKKEKPAKAEKSS